MQRALMAKKDAGWDLFNKFGVVGVGVGYKRIGGEVTDEPCVVVSVVKKVPEVNLLPSERVPTSVWGVRTDVIETGVIVSLQERTDRWRPPPGGVSIGHVDVTAGTLGCLVKRGEEIMVLSNNHVLANCNQGKQGDPIVQPGSYDGGVAPDDVIAELYDYVPVNVIEASDCPVSQALAGGLNAIARLLGSRVRLSPLAEDVGVNLVDAAIAKPVDEVSSAILEIGQPGIMVEGTLGMGVKKSGRTTGLTSGVITQVDMTVVVQYPPAGVAIFTEQLAGDLHCEGGDSGSLVVTDAVNADVVGLLFAGGEGVTIFSQADLVAAALGVSFDV